MRWWLLLLLILWGVGGYAETFYKCVKGGNVWYSNHKIKGAKCTTFLKFSGIRNQNKSKSTKKSTDAKVNNNGKSAQIKVRTVDPEKLEQYISEASARNFIPKALIRAVITVESGFKPYVVSNAGAQGLMQLMPATARYLGVKNPFDPKENIMGGAKLLRRLADMFAGDLTKTIAAYYCGPGAVMRHNGIPDPATRAYVNKVLAYYFKYSPKQTITNKEDSGEQGKR